MNTMNENAQATMTQATITSLTEAVTAIATQLKDLVDLAKAESTVATATTTEVTTTEATTEDTTAVTTTTETTTATTTTTEATTATEATGETTVGYLPCPPEETAETTAAVETKKINLDGLYKVLKYVVEKEGTMVRMDHSPYAPASNCVADIGKHAVYLSKTNEEVKIMIVEVNYYNPSMSITINDKREFLEEIKTFKKEALKADTKLNKFMGVLRDVISLTM